MSHQEFYDSCKSRAQLRLDILEKKGLAYAGDKDAFANFKRNGEKLGLTKYQIWSVYCGKHLDAIFNSIKENPNSPVDKSEGLQGRIDDAVNYLELLAGMLDEEGLL